MTDASATTGDTPADSVDYRQIAFASLAVLALIAAAFVAPVASDGTADSSAGSAGQNGGADTAERGNGDTGGDGSRGDGDGAGESAGEDGSRGDGDSGGGSAGGDGAGDRGGGDGGAGSAESADRDFDGADGGDGASGSATRTPTTRDGATAAGDGAVQCRIELEGEPVPGTDSTVAIYRGGSPVTGVPVWFADERIGTTNERGRVTGRVPYENELRVRAAFGDDGRCRFDARTAGAGMGGGVGVGVGVGAAAGVAAGVDETTIQDEPENATTVAFEVDAAVALAVRGDPYPGRTITVEARIEGHPMANATVERNGETVARTDEDGVASVTVPDDGTAALEIRVSRGEFAGTTSVDVLLLEATLRPQGIALVPGAPATVEATIGGDPVANATVEVDGERRGTTDSNGTLVIELPADPTASVTVSAEEQTATTSVADAYRAQAVPLALLALVVIALAVVAYRRRGPRGVGVVAGGVVAALAIVVADAFWGETGRYAAAGTVAALVLVAVAVRRRSAIRGGAATTGGLLAGIGAWIVARALGVVGALESLLERLQVLAGRLGGWLLALVERGASWLRSLPRSISGLLRRVAGWLRALPGRLVHAARTRPRTAAVVLAVVLALPTSYHVADRTGVGAVVLAVIVGLAVRWWRGDDRPEPTDERTADAPMEQSSTQATDGTAARPSFRELWRAFARRVVPGRWKTSTPGEIARAAVERGYPRGPVRALTTLFREVEYGTRSPSAAVRDRAAEIYRDLERDDEGDER